MSTSSKEPIASENSSELWELTGDRWTIPIRVRWENETAHIVLADIPLLRAQKVLATDTLTKAAQFSHDGEYAMAREELVKHARLSKRTDPEDILEWRKVVAPALHFSKKSGIDEFLDDYAQTGIVQNRATLSAIYSTLCAFMLKRLLGGKPVPLCFATILPFYRNGWALHILHEKLFYDYISLHESILEKRPGYLERCRAMEHFAKITYSAVLEAREAIHNGHTVSRTRCCVCGRNLAYREQSPYCRLPSRKPKKRKPRDARVVAKKNARLSPVPGVQPGTADVRNGG